MKRLKLLLGIWDKQASRPLTRKALYDLAAYCRTYALELAEYEQTRVNLKECYRFNDWLPGVKAYDLLKPKLESLKPARPINRWQVVVILGLVSMFFYIAIVRVLNPFTSSILLYSLTLMLLFIAFFLPERLYGTTIELLEAKVLRVVEALEKVLLSGEMDYSEAAFFQVKENLETAKRELRQQIDLVHRRWR